MRRSAKQETSFGRPEPESPVSGFDSRQEWRCLGRMRSDDDRCRVVTFLFSRVRFGGGFRPGVSARPTRADREFAARAFREPSAPLHPPFRDSRRRIPAFPWRKSGGGVKNGIPANASRFGGGPVGIRSSESLNEFSDDRDGDFFARGRLRRIGLFDNRVS